MVNIKQIKESMIGTNRRFNVASKIDKSKNVVKSFELSQRAENDNSAKRTLTLRIQTEDWSPIMEDPWGWTYKEKISAGAYDESLEAVKYGDEVIYSFADHDMDMKNVISSTQRDGSELFKDADGNYVMSYELDPSIELHKTIIRMMENNELTANSFIFRPLEIDVEEANPGNEVDYFVIQKKGILLSIDPVIYPFYPQNKTIMKGIDMTEEQKAIEAKKVADAKAAEAKKAEEAKVAEEKAKAEEAKAAEEKAKADEAKKAEEAKAAEEKAKADEAKKAEEVDADKKAKKLAEGNKVHSLAELRDITKDMSVEARKRFIDTYGEEKQKQDQAHRDALAKKIKERNMDQKTVSYADAVKVFANTKRWADISKKDPELRNKYIEALNKRNAEVIEDGEVSEKLLNILGLEKRDLTGADANTGAQIISVVTDPKLVGQQTVFLPEAEGAIRPTLTGIRETKVPVDIDDEAVAAAIAEGAEINMGKENVVDLQMSPTRYGEGFNYNALLQEEADLATQKSTNKKNKIIRAWRKEFATNLVANAGATFASIKDNYTGGFSSEAVVETAAASTVTLSDVTGMIDSLVEKYGSDLDGSHSIIMAGSVWKVLKASEKTTGNSSSVELDIKAKTISGIKVILNPYMPAIADGAFVVGLYRKEDVRLYGGSIAVSDSTETEFKKSLQTRKVEARGQLKLADPLFNGKLLKVKSKVKSA